MLDSSAAYIGLVSSPRRAAACRDYLRASGMSEQHIARLKAPAGLDIGASTHAEIATSILAELVQIRHHPTPHGHADEQEIHVDDPGPVEELAGAATALDPVCGMDVEVASARHSSSYHGQTFYFCCPACKREFEREPERFLAVNEKEMR
ncbi:MAG: XdhC family protein [Ktedonobacteraceae bacterium]